MNLPTLTTLKARWAALRPDLQKHLLVGFAIGCMVCVSAWLAAGYAGTLLAEARHELAAALLGLVAEFRHPVFAGLLGLVAGERAGWIKDYVWDASGKGTVDRDDYLFTGRGAVAGAAVGAVMVTLLPLSAA